MQPKDESYASSANPQVQRVLERVENVRPAGSGYKALCPAHDDRNPSLSISEVDDGRILLNCLAGCATEEVVSAIGLTMRDLFPPKPFSNKGQRDKLTATWEIRDRDNRLEAYHLRFDKPDGDKEFKWKRSNGSWGLNGMSVKDLPLYGSERVDEWPASAGVVLAEGENAKDALEAAGIKAVATVTGAATISNRAALEVLEDCRVWLWPDNDPEGRKHMEDIGQELQGIAKEVRWFEWADAPEKGDAADHPAIKARDPEGVRALKRELSEAPIYFHHIHGGFDENKQRNESILPVKSVEEVIEEAGETVPWVVVDLLARGALTEFSGLAKKGGKTTFWCHAIKAGAKGEEHGGFRTEDAKYLYLTEQGNNFAQALRESGLVDYPDHVKIVQFKDVSARQWDTLIRQAAAEAHRRKLDVLVVDTFAVFAKLKGSEENDAGPVADQMRVLRLVAQQYNIAVLLIRHAGKDGTARGSSAFEAEADICVTLSRPDGRHAPNVRKLYAIGRYGEWERNVQLKDGRFVSLGTDNKIEFNDAVRFIKATLPENPDAWMKKQDMLDQRTEKDGDFSVATFDRALGWLVEQGDVGERQLQNERGRPKVYWLSYKPPGDRLDQDEGIYFHQTPSANDGNKSKPQKPRRLDEEEARGVQRLIAEGMMPKLAREEVLGVREGEI